MQFFQFGSIFKNLACVSYMASIATFIVACSPTQEAVTPEKEEQFQINKTVSKICLKLRKIAIISNKSSLSLLSKPFETQ